MSTFSTSSRQKRLKTLSFLTLLTSKCASRHNGVHFFDTFSTSELPKVVRDRQFLTLLTWKCASRHNGVHFFDIWTSKSRPTLRCFVHFDFKMCFAPQRRALFRHLNFQKWSENGVFCTFWLQNVLRATTACTFSTSQLPKVVRTWCVLYILTWKCASRHNGVQFFISHLASWLRTRRFSEPTFRPTGATNHWKKHSVSRLSYLFAHLHLLSSDLVSSDSSHLCFSTVHIVGSFTSKLPSTISLLISIVRPPPCTPPPAFMCCFFFLSAPFATYSHSFFWVHLTIFLLISIESCACVLLSCYALRGEALRPPPCTPPPAFTFCFYFLIGSPCYLLSLLFLVHLTISLLISIESCACVLLSCYALRREALRPPPCTPPPLLHVAFIF